MSSLISVIIVNYNAGDRLQKCLKHLEAQSYKNFELLIVDNGSEDGSMDGLKSEALNMQLMFAGENLGYAAGNNKAVKAAKGEWLAFLNPDAYPDPTWLEACVEAIDTYPDVKAFGSTQVDALNETKLDGAGDVYHILGIAYRGYYGWNMQKLPEEGEVFAACGAGAVYKAKTFRELGGFEERFFCYGEDVDLGFRHRLNGGQTIQLNRAVIRHEGSAITGRHSDFTIYHGHRNRIWLAYKNTPFWLYWPFLPLHFLANFYLLIRTPMFGVTKPFIRGLVDGYKGLHRFRGDRKALLNNRTASYKELIAAIEWSPFKILTRRGKNWSYKD